MLNLKYSEDAIINKIFSYFEKVNIKSFYNVKGTKWYSTQEKLAFLVYKILNLKSYRDLSEIEINGKTPHFTTLQKFADKMSTLLIHKLKVISYLICKSMIRLKKLAAIDGTDTIAYVHNSKELVEAIERNEKVIIVILHNFSHIKDKLKVQKDKRICFIIDETHRSQQGKLHSSMTDFFQKFGDDDLKLNFPNSAFIGFTATPSDKTLEMFGTKKGKDYVAYDTYSMQQAIEEGYILDVSKNIIPYQTIFKLRKESEDKLFEKEFNALQLYKQTKKLAFEDVNVIRDKVRLIIHYFQDKVAKEIDGKAKAMIVSSSRKSAIAYKTILDEELKKRKLNYKSLVAFSGKENCKELNINEANENSLNNFTGEIPKKFKENNFKFLIVADKYQTGFDEPLLYALFLDKPIKGINAVQTLSRLNRTCPYKGELPLTIDFSNSYDNIADAFGRYLISSSSDKVNDYGELIALYQNIMSKGVIDIKDLEEFELISELDGNILQSKFEIFMNKIKERYFGKDKITKTEFRKNLGKFEKSYAYMITIINISDRNINLLGLIAKQIYINLSEDSGLKHEMKQALDNIKIKKHKIVPVEKAKTKLSKDVGKILKGEAKEILKLSINEVMELLDDAFESFVFSKDSRDLFEEYLSTIIKDDKLRKKILNTPVSEEEQTRKSVMKDLDKEIKKYFVMNPEAYKHYEKLTGTDIFDKVNEYAYELIRQDLSN